MDVLARIGSLLLLMAVALVPVACAGERTSTTSAGITPTNAATVSSTAVSGTASSVAATTTSQLPSPTTSDTAPTNLDQAQGDTTPVDEEAQVGDWTVRVVSVTWNADSVVANHSEFNNPPEDGYQYVLVKVRATRIGESSASFTGDVYCTLLGSGGDSFDMAPQDIPDAIRDADPVDKGSAVTGYVVFQASSDQVSVARLVMEASASFAGSRVVFDLE